MLQKIESSEIITIEEAIERYRNNYIGIKITKQDLMLAPKSEGIVMYLADSFKESKKIPTDDAEGNEVYVAMGLNMEDFPGGSFRLIKRDEKE